MQVAIAGAGGYLGRKLCVHLAEGGVDVVAIARHKVSFPDGLGIEQRCADLDDRDAAAEALAGATHAVYLLHSLKRGSAFPELDRALAEGFAQAASTAGVRRIVYLGGLGSGELSPHLSSRQDVGRVLAGTGIPVVEFRAAVVLGTGSISFEMLRYLSERLPAMTCPRWVRTRIQPIAERDVLAYLEAGLTCEPGIYEIGGPDVTTYRDMIRTYASVRGLRPRLILDLPWLSLKLSAYWVDLVTPVNRTISHELIQSLASEVVVTGGDAAALPVHPIGLREAIAGALEQQVRDIDRTLMALGPGQREGVHVMRTTAKARGRGAQIRSDLQEIGGDLGWYGVPNLWRARIALGRLLGEWFLLRKPATLAEGAPVDWWTVVDRTDSRLVLRASDWRVGEGWLGYEVADDRLRVVAAFRERGVLGFLYWTLASPIHRYAFSRMAGHRVARAAREGLAPRRMGVRLPGRGSAL